MKLTAYERETILLFNEEEKEASVYTHNSQLKERLAMMAKKYPSSCRLEKKNSAGGMTYIIDKRLIQIRLPYDEKRRQKDQERAKAKKLIPPGNKKQQRARAQKSSE